MTRAQEVAKMLEDLANWFADNGGARVYKAEEICNEAAALLQSRDSAIAERDARIAALEKENADLVKQVNGLIERVDELKRALRITEPAIRHVRA